MTSTAAERATEADDDIWQPRSGCGAQCIADDEPGPRVGLPLRVGRMAALVAVMLTASAALLVLPLLTARRRALVVRGVARGVLRSLGIRLEQRGAGLDRRAPGSLVVVNHVSWLDIVVLLAVGRSRLVAKTEVRGWPVVGQIARYVGTIFVDRSRPTALPDAVAEVRRALAAGQAVSFFPEGTTSCGRAVRRFRPAFFQAAVDTGAPVVPVTLRFAQAGSGRTSRAAFIGDDTLLDSLGRVVGLRDLTISVSYGATIYPQSGATRRVLARVAATAVGASVPAVATERRVTITLPAPRQAPVQESVAAVPEAVSVPEALNVPEAVPAAEVLPDAVLLPEAGALRPAA
jgi:1-acyl-sn-glycerol-3-phosphate acyltransferase